MKTLRTIITGTTALTLGAGLSFGQSSVTRAAGNAVTGTAGAVRGAASGTANAARNLVSNPLGTTSGAVRSVGSGAMSGLKGLASMPGKAFSIGDGALPDLSAGTQEFGIAGNVQFGGDTVYNVDISYGYFFKDNWEVGFNTLIQGSDSQFTLGLGLFTEYNFDLDSKWVPFIGASVGLATLNTDDGGSISSNFETVDDVTSVTFGGVFGIKYFFRENIAITASVDFQFSPDDVFGGVEDASESSSNINIGTRFYF